MKRFILIAAVAAIALVSCTKKNGNEPVAEETQQPKDTTATDTTGAAVSIVGTWMTTDKAYSAVYFYYRDGTYCDSINGPLEGMTGFTFRADGKVETPWEMTSKYVYENNQVIIDMVAGVKRVYDVRELTESHLVMEHRDTSEYFTEEDTVIGYELEYWDMERN